MSTRNSTPPDPVLTVLYDGACPICSREIAWYRRRQAADRIAWRDVSQPQCPLPDHLSRETVLARFHVCCPDGQTLSGALAFVELWSHTPGLRWLAGLIRGLHLVPWLEWGYRCFLPLRGYLARALGRRPG